MSITVTEEDGRFVARFYPWSQDTKNLIKEAGFRFDGDRKLWFTKDATIAAKLQGGNPAEIAARMNQAATQQYQADQQAIIESRQTDSDLVVPLGERAKAKGLDYFPYQKAGIEYLIKRLRSVNGILLGDEMGLGKSIQVIGYLNVDTSIERALIVCPASIKLNWAKELWLWLSRDLPICLANGKDFPAVKIVTDVDRGHVVTTEGTFTRGVLITNYEMVMKLRLAGMDDFDLLVTDEHHYLKSSDAQRTQAILGKWHNEVKQRIDPLKAKRKIFLSGTPILNKPKELWTVLKSLDPGGLGNNWRTFHTRYCNGHVDRRGHWNIDGASNLDELQARLRAGLMIRRMKAEVLTDLPPYRQMIVAFQPASPEELAALENEHTHTEETEAELNTLREEVERLSVDEASEAYKAAAEALRKARGVAFSETSLVRHRVDLAKIPQCLAHIRDTLESEHKLVVFVHHHDMGDQIAEALAPYGVLRVDGRDSVKVRDEAVWKFQNEPEWRVLVAGTLAMGEGHTLTAASTCIFCSLDWVPGRLSQAAARLHRIGQHDSVLVQHLVLDGSLDQRMTELLLSKAEVIEQALDSASARLPEPEPIEIPAPAVAEAPAAPYRAWRPGSKPSTQAEAIHQALKLIAGLCDGARALDGMGFSKFDAGFGRSLASQESLTPRQVEAGLMLVLKYQRQVPETLLKVAKGE